MNEQKSKIFSTYYIKKNNDIIGPIRYEQLKELMYNKQLNGSESISEDKEIWNNVRTILIDLDSFLSAEQEEMYNSEFLNLIKKNSEYKVKTTFNIVMGPFDNQKLFNLIKQEKIEKEYNIICQDMSVPFKKISKRLEDKIEKILSGKIPDEKITEKEKQVIRPKTNNKKRKVEKEDLDEIESLQSIDTSSIEDFNEISEHPSKVEIKKIKKLSEDNIKGLLSTKPLLSLLFTYSMDKLTGLLEISRKSAIYELSFKKGKLAYITSNQPELSLPRFLNEKKNIKVNYPENLSDEALIPKLISERKIDPAQIYDLLKELIIYRLKKIFKIINGKFLFKIDITTENTSLNIDFLTHIWKFTSELISIDIINDYITTIENHVILKDERRFNYNKYLKLGPIELKLLNKINNKVTTKQFLNALKKQKKELLDTFKKLIYLLYNLRFIKKGDLVSSRNLEEEISELKEQIKKIEIEDNHFITLGIPQETPLSTIRKIYIKAAKDYHPDKLSKEVNEEIKELKTLLYTYISTAYNKISTEDKLASYKKELNEGGGETFNAESLFKSEELFDKCKKAIKVGKFERALDFIDEAISIFSENQEFMVHKYYLDFLFSWQENIGKAKTSLKNLETLMKEMEKYPDGYRFLGRMYKNLNDPSQAKLNFRKLLSLIPYDSEAKRESR